MRKREDETPTVQDEAAAEAAAEKTDVPEDAVVRDGRDVDRSDLLLVTDSMGRLIRAEPLNK